MPELQLKTKWCHRLWLMVYSQPSFNTNCTLLFRRQLSSLLSALQTKSHDWGHVPL